MMGFLQSGLITVASFLFVLGLVVTVHEYGHFLVARLCGVAVDRFSIGFGRPLIAWKGRTGIEYWISWIPLGGYVKFSGDENAASVPDADDLEAMRSHFAAEGRSQELKQLFYFKPLWQRALVVAAGPFANFVLSSILFALLLGAFGETRVPPRVASVVSGSPAEKAGLKPGDVILAADGRRVSDFTDLSIVFGMHPGKTMPIKVRRDGAEFVVAATPASQIDQSPVGEVKVGRLGVGFQGGEHVRYNPLQAIVAGVGRTADLLDTTVYVLGQMITGNVALSNVNGIVGIGHAAGAVAHEGAQGAPNVAAAALGAAVALLGMAAAISVSIGFMNLLPVPVLDGGHLLFYAYEALARRPVGARVQAVGYRVGLALLLGLMLFATWNDLQRLRVFKMLGGLFS